MFGKKKDDTLRLCADYRNLNAVTIKHCYLLFDPSKHTEHVLKFYVISVCMVFMPSWSVGVKSIDLLDQLEEEGLKHTHC